MIDNKVHFLQQEYIPLLQKLSPGQKGIWGKMDAQQMAEHMVLIFKVANGTYPVSLINNDPGKLSRNRDFIMSNEPLPQSIRVPGIPEDPDPYRYKSLAEAIEKAAVELNHIFTVYAADPGKKLMHPMLGELDYEQQIHYVYKHVRHHLKQFGLID